MANRGLVQQKRTTRLGWSFRCFSRADRLKKQYILQFKTVGNAQGNLSGIISDIIDTFTRILIFQT